MEKEYLEMLLENMDSKFDLVLEGQESLREEETCYDVILP